MRLGKLYATVAICALGLASIASAQTKPLPAPAPLSALVRATDIPHERFVLPNGLRVIVHTDRKAPIVAVSVWYGVGAGDEPPGKTGFAHLFEHLMFNGSGNYDGDFFIPLEEVGGTDYNGTTNSDRTNYFENVPTPALERTLFLEADRMGNLLPAVTQEKLDNQRGVVQNEKRQGDNQPYGLIRYAQAQYMYPEGHPYHHTTIGSMADLDAASLEDVQAWFKRYYGPNNAVLVLAGDIDLKTAKPLVEKYFGSIPRGPAVAEPAGGIPKLAGVKRVTMNDRVANPRVYLSWPTPGRVSQDLALTDVAATILASGQSSRLHNALVREEKLAVSVSGGAYEQQLTGVAQIVIDVKPGVDPAVAEARAQALIDDFVRSGPTADEVQRVATRVVSGTIRGLEQIGGFGGKAVTLAEGELYANDADFYKRQLGWYAGASAASVKAAAQKWMTGGSVRILVQPGERGPAELALAGVASARPEVKTAATGAKPDASKLPPVSSEAKLEFPAVERATLSNGVKVTFARRAAAPVVTVSAVFDAGSAADSREKPGLQLLTLSALREGAGGMDGRAVTEQFERLGAQFYTGFSADTTDVTVSALKPNLAASLTLMSEVLKAPTFAPAEIDRLRQIQLARVAQEINSPNGLAQRTLSPLVFGPAHPYGGVSAQGTAAGLEAITRDDIVGFHQTWMRPDTMQLFVVGDTTLAEITPQLEAAFGAWKAADGVAKGAKKFTPPAPQGVGKIVLVDRPNSPQSVIVAAAPLALKGADDPLALRLANVILGGNFISRLNSDLRETKGWSYGVRSGLTDARGDLSFRINAPVQADRTADSIRALKANTASFVSSEPMTADERARAVNSVTLSLPGDYETADAVLSALQQNASLGRPDDYQTTIAARYRAITAPAATTAAKAAIDPEKLIWVVVGDAKVVEPQLKALGMPYEVRKP